MSRPLLTSALVTLLLAGVLVAAGSHEAAAAPIDGQARARQQAPSDTGLRISRSANGPGPYRPGRPVTFEVAVTARGTAGAVTVTDTTFPGCSRDLGTLAAGTTRRYRCTGPAPARDVTATAVVTGRDARGAPVRGAARTAVDVIRLALAVTSRASSPTGTAGGPAPLTVIVRNAGDVPLMDVTVSDARAGSCSAVRPALAAGASFRYRCTGSPAGVVTATGRDPLAGRVTARAPATVPSPAVRVAAQTIAGTVFSDRDGNGLPDVSGGDTPIAGVRIDLTANDTLSAAPLATTTTDADGRYAFTGLAAGTYVVTETQPAGFDDGIATAGTGATVTGENTFTVVLPAGQDSTANLFAELPAASLSGQVYRDNDNDGQAAAAEPGITATPVTLTGVDADGHQVSLSTTTGVSGTFVFPRLRAGTYTVTETQPAGFVDGRDTAGTSGGVAGPADSITGIGLADRTEATGYLFGELVGASIAGQVTVRDGGGPIPSTGMFLTGLDYAGQTVSLAQYTDLDGRFSFDGLAPGTYTVREGQPFGYGDDVETIGDAGGRQLRNDEITDIELAAGQRAGGYDFRNTVGSLSGLVYLDRDGDGERDDGDPPLEGVTLRLTGTDVYDDPVDRSVVTGADGVFTFDAVLKGGYTLTETQPAGYGDGQDLAGTSGGTPTGADSITGITFAPGADASGYVFGETPTSLTGTVYRDSDGDGVLGGTEAGLPGVTVILEDSGGHEVDRQVTPAGGRYSFPSLAAGDYVLREEQPGGYGSTTPNTVPVRVVAGVAGNVDFGDALGRLGDRVWSDTNGDGAQDPGEPGIAGVTLTLIDETRALARDTTTGANGTYAFDDLPVGTYVLRLTLPPGTAPTEPARFGAAINSDFDPLSRLSAPITVAVNGDEITRRSDVDAGLLNSIRDVAGAVTVDNPAPAIGDQVVITSTVTNSGNVALAGARAVLTVPDGLAVESRGGTGWACGSAGQVVTCTTDALIRPAATAAALVVTARATAAVDTSVISLLVSLRNGEPDDNSANDRSDATLTVPLDPMLPGDPGDVVWTQGPATPLADTGTPVLPELVLAALLLATGVLARLAGRPRRRPS